MPTTPVPSNVTFIFHVPTANLTIGPAGNPWRPRLYTFDLEAAIAAGPAKSLAATLLVGNTTGARDVVVDGGQALRGAAATTLTLVGPAGFSATATTGDATVQSSAGQAILAGSTAAQVLSSAGVSIVGITTVAVAAGTTMALTGGTGFTATATTGTAAMNSTAGAANISAGTTTTIATATGITATTTAADTTAVSTMTSGGANGATVQTFVGNRATPEGAITANPGANYRQNTGTAGTVWTKLSGAGNTGWARPPRVSNAGTNVSAPDFYTATVTTDASGDFTADYSALGFTTFARVWVQGIRNTTTVTDMVWASIRTRSLTAAAGTVLEGNVLAALGATVSRAPAGLSVDLLVLGA